MSAAALPRARAAGGFLLIALAGAWAYAPSLRGGWLWDDDQYVTDNPLLRSAGGLLRIWTAPAGVNYFPVTDSVRWVQWHLWQDHPAGYRVTNLGLHLAAALLLWRVAGKLRVPAPGGWLAGLLFVVHPLAVESVAWVSELKNTLSLPLLLLSFGAWLDFDREGGESARLRSLGWFLLALLAKSTVAAFPLLLLLHAWWRRARIGRRDLRQVAPFLLVALALGAVTVGFERVRAIGADAPALEGFGARLVASGLAAWFYLGHCLWPADLAPIYPRWAVQPPSWPQLAAWPVLAAVAWAGWMRRAGWGRHLVFALGSFLACLLPVLGLVPMAYLRLAWAADHFAYAALACFCVAAGAALAAAADRLAWRRPWATLGPDVAGVILAICAVGASRAYARAFESPEALWSLAVARNPGAWSAHNDLGYVRYAQGRLPEAIAEFEAAARANPRYPEALNNLGAALADAGRLAEAEARCRQALALRPGYAGAWCNLGNALLRSGRSAEAAEAYRRALLLRPDFPEARYNLGLALRLL